MIKVFTLAVLLAPLSSFAGTESHADYGFDWLSRNAKCEHIDGETIEGFKCSGPEVNGESGHPNTTCTSPDKKVEYLIFANKKQCLDELKIQRANAN